ncbi:MAG: phosphonate transport system substrate-binding protein [Comamonadaceae bacterium]|nr:MAG: phosphonate transport system substrate-binding protein [Comamonadaceae bacterium]
MSKFLRLMLMVIWLGAASFGAHGKPEGQTIRFAMTPAFLHDQHGMLAQWRLYLENQLHRPVEFVQRDRYRETIDLLQQQKVDFAWICDYPYLVLKNDVKLLAVALHQGQPSYQSYLIVPAKDRSTRSIADLKNTLFAFADPYSNTGYLSPRFEVKRNGSDPATFFKRTFFTWSHRKVIDAVASGVVQGASVDSYVWESLNKVRPDITAKTRVAWKSELYGFPPMVAQRNVSDADFALMQGVLMDMPNNAQGRAILGQLNLDGFIKGSPQLYDGVAEMMRQFGEP